jgi:hypothetical protein
LARINSVYSKYVGHYMYSKIGSVNLYIQNEL